MALGVFVRPSVFLIVILVTRSGILPLPVPATVFSSDDLMVTISIATSSGYAEINEEESIVNRDDLTEERNVDHHDESYPSSPHTIADNDEIETSMMDVNQFQEHLVVKKKQIESIQTLLGESHYSEFRRVKRSSKSDLSQMLSSLVNNNITSLDYDIKFQGNKTIVCVDTSIIQPPNDRMSLKVSRWLIIAGATAIVTCALCIVFFYCRWKYCSGRGRIRRNRERESSANPRSTISALPSKPPRRPPALYNQAPLLNNAVSSNLPLPHGYGGGDNYSHPRRGITNSEYFQYLKALEKNPEQLPQLMLDL